MASFAQNCNDEDVDRVFHIISETPQHTQPYIEAMFLKHDIPKWYKEGNNCLLEMQRKDPGAKLLKAINHERYTTVEQANWLIFGGMPMAETLEGNFWDSFEDKKVAQQLVGQFMEPRSNAAKAANGRLLGTLER
ncbi:hypothetical protein MMC28_011184 [Mycoblastus sanguinarius]|nr:hypothetical protein [Mycoblastus sanguinarius]